MFEPLELQVGGDVRQRDVHGGDVEDDHQLRDEQHGEQPAMRLRMGVRAVDRPFLRGVLGLVVHGLTSS